MADEINEVDPKILMAMEERLRLNKTNSYYQRELARLDAGSDYMITAQFCDPDGGRTKWLSLNLESIPDIIDWLQSVQSILKMREKQ